MNPMQQMLAQAKKIERELKNAHAALAEQEFVVKKAGIVEVTMMGNKTIKNINIEADALTAENKEMIEDTIVMAIKDAMEQVQAASDEIDERITGQKGALGF